MSEAIEITETTEVAEMQLDPEVASSLETVYEDPKLEWRVETKESWEPDWDLEAMDEWEVPQWLEDFLESLFGGVASGAGGAATGLAGVFTILAWGLLAVLVGVILFYLSKMVARRRAGMDLLPKKPSTTSVMGMEVTADSLPKDIVGAARQLFAEGQAQPALSLLYRGALSYFILEQHAPIESSDTEMECLRKVQALEMTEGEDKKAYLAQLTEIWVALAYAKTELKESTFNQLCETWKF